jgi:hypothetical protein
MTGFFMAAAPNPTNDATTLHLGFEQEEQNVNIVLRDMRGTVVAEVLTNQQFAAGTHDVPLPTDKLPTGTYQCTLQSDLRRKALFIQVIK